MLVFSHYPDFSPPISGVLPRRRQTCAPFFLSSITYLTIHREGKNTMFHEQKDADSKGYYITTAIDYPNAPPHIGHSLEKVAADVVARFHRLQGHDTYFSIGLDENSQHVVRAAEANGIDPTTWVNKMSEVFQQAWSGLDISYDYWIRTTQEAVIFGASQELFRRAQARGDIYKSVYSGWYCPNCNTFSTDEELVEGKCPNHPSLTPEWLEEDDYFLRSASIAIASLSISQRIPSSSCLLSGGQKCWG